LGVFGGLIRGLGKRGVPPVGEPWGQRAKGGGYFKKNGPGPLAPFPPGVLLQNPKGGRRPPNGRGKVIGFSGFPKKAAWLFGKKPQLGGPKGGGLILVVGI